MFVADHKILGKIKIAFFSHPDPTRFVIIKCYVTTIHNYKLRRINWVSYLIICPQCVIALILSCR